jgi:hypothetical protein
MFAAAEKYWSHLDDLLGGVLSEWPVAGSARLARDRVGNKNRGKSSGASCGGRALL